MPPAEPPRTNWFPGYTVAGAATVAFIATAPGQTFVLSLLNGPLREAFGIGELPLNASYAVATVLASFPLVLVGAWTDRVGPRLALAGAGLAFGAACLVMSAVTGFAGVVLAFFLLRFLGQGALAMISQHALAMWFHRRLGAVHGVKQVIVFGAWALFPQGALLLIESVGWRWTYVVFAGLIWIAVVPLALLAVRDRPEQLGLRMDDDPSEPERGDEEAPTTRDDALASEFTMGEALRTRAYWTIAAAVFLSPLIGTAFLFDMQPILARRGMDAGDAALAVSAWTGAMALMAIPAGWLTDRARPSSLIPLGVGAIALSALALWKASVPLAAAVAMALFAVGQSLIATCAAATTARYFGRAHHGAIRSSIIRIGVIGTGLGPIFTGLSVSITDAYTGAMLAFLAMCLPVLLLNMGLRRPRAQARA